MAANQIRTLLQFVNLQIGAEALLGFDPRASNGEAVVLVPGATVSDRAFTAAELQAGNRRSSLFPNVVATEFSEK